MTMRIAALAMAALLLLYLFLVIQLAVRLFAVDEPVGKALGVALIVLPLVGLWALAAELLFGVRSERLGRELRRAGAEPLQNVSRLPSGRVDRASANAVFGQYSAEVEAAPDDWRSWFRLGLAYDACGDRRRARSSIRRAIALERSSH